MKARAYDILNQFIAINYPVSLERIAQEFQVSERTIRNEIHEINEFLLLRDMPLINSLRNKGFILELSMEEKKSLIEIIKEKKEKVYFTREERLLDLILEFSLGEPGALIYKKEDEYQVSKSTLDNDMKCLREILSGYEVKLVSLGSQGVILQGSERTIRTMLFDVINRMVGVVNIAQLNNRTLTLNENILLKYIKLSDFEIVNTLYDSIISETDYDIYRSQSILLVLIWVYRLNHSDYLAIKVPENENVSSECSEESRMTNFIDQVCEEFQMTVPSIEKKYINFMLETLNGDDVSNTIEWVQSQVITIQLIRYVELETKIPFRKKEEALYEGLQQHIAKLISRINEGLQVMNPLTENIKSNYNPIFNSIKQFFYKGNIKKVMFNAVTDDELAFLTIHFLTSASELNKELRYFYKAVVLCNHGVATGNLLAAGLKERFEIDIVAVLSSSDTKVIEKLDVDVVFSTSPINFKIKPVLILDPIITEKNETTVIDFLKTNKGSRRLKTDTNNSTNLFYSILDLINLSGGTIENNIYMELENVFKEFNLPINKRELQPMLQDILEDKNILIGERCETWREAIEVVALPLLKQEVINESYVKAMKAAVEEYGPYIVIGEHVALAHARPEDGVNKLGVSVALLDPPVEFGNSETDPVKIIFCLAAVDSYSHLNIMKSLVNLINDEDKLIKLTESKSIQSFKEVLFSV